MAGMTYSKAGVNRSKEEFIVDNIIGVLSKTLKFRDGKAGKTLLDIGNYANLVELGDWAVAVTTDGVGSKVLVAQELEIYDTIGIDAIAMNVNDVICVGAEPITFVDYLALENQNSDMVEEIVKGLYEGAKIAGVSIIGGETAALPEIIAGIEGRGFDLAGTAVGVVKKEDIIDGRSIREGDAIIGFESSGIHSNGLTLARKVVPRNMWQTLLTPTRIYVKETMSILSKYRKQVHGIAHITGGGFTNLKRLSKYGFVLDRIPEPPMIFKEIQKRGQIEDREMYETFNMGIGLCMVVDPTVAEEIMKEYRSSYGLTIIGKVAGTTTKVVKDGKDILL